MKRTPESLYWECYSHHIQIDYQVWTYFYWRLIKKYVKARHLSTSNNNLAVLDFGCGTGMSTLFWKTFPYVHRVVGVDNDANQLGIARFRGVETYASIRSAVARRGKFNAIVSYNDVPNTIEPKQLARSMFKPSYDALASNGVLVFDFLTPEKHSVANVNPITFGEWKVVQRITSDAGGFKRIQIAFYHKGRLVITVFDYLLPPAFILESLTRVGFRNTIFHKMLSEKPLQGTRSKATRLVCVALR